jgi:ABC-type antimicrobial peptide transport system permease subunit
VGIRKVTGALRTSLIAQFLLESIMLAALAGILSLILVLMILPGFNSLMGKELILPYANPVFWLSFTGFILLTGILAGSYPAFFLSSFNPVGVLKGHFKKTGALVTPRKVLVVFQFCIAIVLIISTIIVTRQIHFAKNRNAGYAGSALGYHWITLELAKNYQLVKRDLLASGNVSSVARTAAQLTEQFSSTTAISWSGKDPTDNTEIERGAQDEGLIKTAGLKLLKGRDFDLAQFPTDSTGILINQSAATHMGFKDPIGQIIREGDMEYHVVGVFEDYIFGSPYERTKPMVIFGPKNMWFNIVYMRLKPTDNVTKQVETIGAIFRKYAPSYPFEYHFVDDDYARKFEDLELTSRLTGLFAMLTILISCLGLFGLASYMAETRIKEIGIRKVLGASGMRITSLLSKDFVILIAISLLLACPIAWFSMNSWLNGYSYRTSIEWWIFAGTGLFAILITVATVSYHSIKAVLANPVKSLRTE